MSFALTFTSDTDAKWLGLFIAVNFGVVQINMLRII
jgi:hypothetical protein